MPWAPPGLEALWSCDEMAAVAKLWVPVGAGRRHQGAGGQLRAPRALAPPRPGSHPLLCCKKRGSRRSREQVVLVLCSQSARRHCGCRQTRQGRQWDSEAHMECRREAFWVCGKSWELTCLLWPGPSAAWFLKVPLQTGREQGREQV